MLRLGGGQNLQYLPQATYSLVEETRYRHKRNYYPTMKNMLSEAAREQDRSSKLCRLKR